MNLSNIAKRFFASPPQSEVQTQAKDPFAACHLVANQTAIADCMPRTSCTVVGVVRAVRSLPETHALETTIEDEHGDTLVGQWHGRSELPGVKEGSILALTGTVSLKRGRTMMLEPVYTIVDGDFA